MGLFPALPLGRRPIRSRILVVYRLDAAVVAPLLPEGSRPRIVQGYAVASACYTRLGTPRLLRGRGAGSEHLAYRFAIEREGKDGWRDATWIARRETSSWLEARCGAKLLRGVYDRAAFRFREDAFAVELTVNGERGEEFYLRGEACGGPVGSLFPSPQSLHDFLEGEGHVEPHDVFAPEADQLDPEHSFAPEPLAVFESRSAFFAERRFPAGRVQIDSAWRLVTRRMEALPARSRLRTLPEIESGQPSPALPSM